MQTKEDFRKAYKIKPEEEGFVHVLLTKIVKEGKRTRDVFAAQIFTVREFQQFKVNVEKLGIAITGYDEYEMIHNGKQIKKTDDDTEKVVKRKSNKDE